MYLSCVFFVNFTEAGHRLSALSKTTWSEQTKDEIKQVLTVEYTSSDESSYEPDSDSEVPQLLNKHWTIYTLSLFQGESVNHLFL